MRRLTVTSVLKAPTDHVLRIHKARAPTPKGRERGCRTTGRSALRWLRAACSWTGALATPNVLEPCLRAALDTMEPHDPHAVVLQAAVREPDTLTVSRLIKANRTDAALRLVPTAAQAVGAVSA